MDKHFVDENGNHFVIPDFNGDAPDGSTPIPSPPSSLHTWVNGAWTLPNLAATNILSAPEMGFGGPTIKELVNGNR